MPLEYMGSELLVRDPVAESRVTAVSSGRVLEGRCETRGRGVPDGRMLPAILLGGHSNVNGSDQHRNGYSRSIVACPTRTYSRRCVCRLQNRRQTALFVLSCALSGWRDAYRDQNHRRRWIDLRAQRVPTMVRTFCPQSARARIRVGAWHEARRQGGIQNPERPQKQMVSQSPVCRFSSPDVRRFCDGFQPKRGGPGPFCRAVPAAAPRLGPEPGGHAAPRAGAHRRLPDPRR